MKTSQITMTTLAGEVEITLGGTGMATIDWGDGSKRKTRKLKPFDSSFTYENYKSIIKKKYSDKSAHTITITGKNITYLGCSDNKLTVLDVSRCTALIELFCPANQLTELDVSRNTALTEMLCFGNQLKTLDVNKNTALEVLICDENHLTELDVTKNTALIQLRCDYNRISELDVSKNTALKKIFCNSNELTALDLSQNTALEQLSCYNNQLTALDVSRNTMLKELSCYNNQFTAAALNALFETLHNNHVSDRKVFIYDKTADCDTSIAEKKGWKMK